MSSLPTDTDSTISLTARTVSGTETSTVYTAGTISDTSTATETTLRVIATPVAGL